MGSGSLNAMAVFEASYKEDMTQQEAENLVARAIRSGAAAGIAVTKTAKPILSAAMLS